MIAADEFLDAALAEGFDFYAGVPCSLLTPLINGALSRPRLDYVAAASEGEAIGIAAGAWLAGRGPVAMFQNSGLGNAVNPLSSLTAPFRIPMLLVTSWRGQPGQSDEPQHELMGSITHELLQLLEIELSAFPQHSHLVAPFLRTASDRMSKTGLPYALVMSSGQVREEALHATPFASRQPGMSEKLDDGRETSARAPILEALLSQVPETAAIIATTGKCGRELYTIEDRPQHFYHVGAMGGASALGLGVALNSSAPVVVLDGDGAALMRLGTMATIGAYHPANLVHIVFDNGAHDSTGGQPTVAPVVDFPAMALACGYRYAATCGTVESFADAYRRASMHGPSLIHVRIKQGAMANLGRPTVAPREVAQRFRAFLTEPTEQCRPAAMSGGRA